MSMPFLHSPTWGPLDAPPYKTTTRAFTAGANFSASAPICNASSRVGAITRTLGRAGSEDDHPHLCGTGAGPRCAMRARAGKRKPHVLPLPVFATATMSWPVRAIGQACAWIGDGAAYPCARSALPRAAPRAGAAASKVSNGAGQALLTIMSCRFLKASAPSSFVAIALPSVSRRCFASAELCMSLEAFLFSAKDCSVSSRSAFRAALRAALASAASISSSSTVCAFSVSSA
mmetsp:Transcript_89471/g.140038  ORF Transcript_89471/g.140038 Transcript_89471/m.140038 type:complete len:232 (-) Transcript_89471:170-865(-)